MVGEWPTNKLLQVMRKHLHKSGRGFVKTPMTSLNMSVPSMYHNAQASTGQACKTTANKAVKTPPDKPNC